MYLGIDISKHNGEVNVKKVRDAGYKRIIIRAGYGKNNIDQKFIDNATACVNLSEPSGIYWFSYAFNEAMAASEGANVVEAAKKYWDKCPIAFDLEYDTVNYARKNGVNITKTLASKMAIAFLSVVVAEGFIPVLYTNKDYMQNYFDIETIETALGIKLYIWYARYTSNISDKEKAAVDIWQKSSSATIPGISGNVDLNEFYTDFEDIVKTEQKAATTCNINILNFQIAANKDGYKDADGNKLKEDGIDGSKTQYVRKQIALKAKKTLFGYKAGSTGAVVAWWQKRLNELSFTTDIDGSYGKDSRAKTIKMQEKFNLTADGVAGYNAISTAFYN